MTGFPPTDAVYYENPSLRIGGLIAYTLHQEVLRGNSPCIDISATSPCLPLFRREPYLRQAASLAELCESLRKEHTARYWYRGQTSQHTCAYSGKVRRLAEAFPQLDTLRIRFENWVPSSFRGVMKDWSKYEHVTSLDHVAPAFRAVARCTDKQLRNMLADGFRPFINETPWIALTLGFRVSGETRGTGLPQGLLNFIALSQHYEYQSTMVDVTKNVDVAAWFASHKWLQDEPIRSKDGVGVIYRFDRVKLNECLAKELLAQTAAAQRIRDVSLLGFADISGLDGSFAPRAFLQEGGSLFGFENSIATLMVFAYEAVEVFVFQHENTEGDETSVSRWDDLCPQSDPLRQIFDTVNKPPSQPISAEELEHFLCSEGFEKSEITRIKFARRHGYL